MSLSAYEEQRLATIRANELKLKELGLHESLVPRKSKHAPKPRKRKVVDDSITEMQVKRARGGDKRIKT